MSPTTDKLIPPPNKRLDYIDIARGLSILAVVLGHFCYSNHQKIQILLAITRSINIPLILILSGYFISTYKQPAELIKTRAKSLLIPYYVTAAIYLILSIAAGYFYGHSFDTLWEQFLHQAKGYFLVTERSYDEQHTLSLFGYGGYVGPIYFLWMLFIANVVVILSRARTITMLLLFGFALMGYATYHHLALPFTIQSGLFATIFVYIGSLIKKYRLLEKKVNIYIILSCFALWIGLLFLGQRVDMRIAQVGGSLLFLPSILAGVLLTIQVSKLLQYIKPVALTLQTFGRHTLLFLCVHQLEVFLLPWGTIRNHLLFPPLNSIYHQVIERWLISILLFFFVLGISNLYNRITKRNEAKQITHKTPIIKNY